jgi:hypothetical protein
MVLCWSFVGHESKNKLDARVSSERSLATERRAIRVSVKETTEWAKHNKQTLSNEMAGTLGKNALSRIPKLLYQQNVQYARYVTHKKMVRKFDG